jgi:hypothetical protein
MQHLNVKAHNNNFQVLAAKYNFLSHYKTSHSHLKFANSISLFHVIRFEIYNEKKLKTKM